MFAKPELERQEDNDTQSILEHQLLFTLHTRLEIQKHFKEIEEAAEVNIQELIMTNKDRVKDQRKITDNIGKYISNCKTIINQSQKEDWDFLETFIEEYEQEKNIAQLEIQKRRPGRPTTIKEESQKMKGQTSIESFFQD